MNYSEQLREKWEKEGFLQRLQAEVDEIKKTPNLTQYVKDRKLHLIDERFETLDLLLTMGWVK